MKNKKPSQSYVFQWIKLRVSAVALVFLFSWLMYVLFELSYKPELVLQNLLYSPVKLTGFIALFNISIYHGLLGFKEVCEDYINDTDTRNSVIVMSYIIGFGTMCALTLMLLINFWFKI